MRQHHRRRPLRHLLLLAICSTALATLPAAAHEGPEHGTSDPVDGPVEEHGDKQHDGIHGHLPASRKDVELVGRVDLTSVANGISDVAAFGRYAYLNAFSPECAGRPGAQGTGVHVVDIADPSNPTKVTFLPAEPNSYVGEGVHVIDFRGRQYLLHNNETCDADQPVVSGFSLWRSPTR